MDEGLILYITFYFEVKNAKLYGGVGTVGYAKSHFDSHPTDETCQGWAELCRDAIRSTACILDVEPEDVRLISEEEYQSKAKVSPDDIRLHYDYQKGWTEC